MADEIPTAPAAPVSAAPAAVEPVAAPAVVAETPPTPAIASAPVAEPAPAVAPAASAPISDAKPAEPPVSASTEPVSLLGEAEKPAPEPKAEAKPEGDKPAAEAKPEGDAPAPEEAPAEVPLPSYDVLTVPEGVELEDPQVDKFVGTVAEFERVINPAGDPKVHTAVQGLMQTLLDQYTEEVGQLATRVNQINAETFSRTMENWKDEFFNDADIGGNRKETTLQAAKGVIGRFGGSSQQVAEVRQILSSTGAGNNVHVIRLFNNIASFLSEGQPVPALKPEPQAMSRTERRYGKK